MFLSKLLFWALVFFCLLEIKTEIKELFDVKADELMEVMLDGVYKGYLKKYRNIGGSATISNIDFLSTKSIVRATKKKIHQEGEEKLTYEEFNKRRRRRAQESLLALEINPSPNFQASHDEILIQTRRFQNLTRVPYQESARREVYIETENKTFISGEKNKTMHLMQQFIYETHYMMPYMQVLRQKYITDVKYQLGYCFALLRNLKKQQMMIYSTFKKYFDLILTVYAPLQFYQKIIRLDVDIKDVLRLMYALDAQAKRESKRRKTTTPSYQHDEYQ